MTVTREQALEARLRECLVLLQSHGLTETGVMVSRDAREAIAMPSAHKAMLSALYECEEYFDNRADADGDSEGFHPNKEMKLLIEVRKAIQRAAP